MKQSAFPNSPDDGVGPGTEVTDAIATFASAFDYDAIPVGVSQRIKLHLIDTIGCAIAGCDIDIARRARSYAMGSGTGGPCRIFGERGGFPPAVAAFANGVIANALDFDDGFEVDGKGMGHPGASLVPAALAALGLRPASGRDVIAALAIGYEINNRLILAMQPSAERFTEVYGIAQHQAIGAAVVFGRLMGFSSKDMRNALGLAGALTCLPSLHKYNWTTRPIISLKDGVASAAQAGVQAGLMTLAGFVGSTDVFDGPQGYWRMNGSDRFDPTLAIGGLESEWRARQGSFKLYPACRWLAPALEAFEVAQAELRVSPSEIAAIEIMTFSIVVEKLMDPSPHNAIDAQFSLPFLIGVIASGRAAGESWFSEAAMVDSTVRAIAAKLSVVVDLQMDRLMRGQTRRPSASARVTTTDGRIASHHVTAPRGGEIRPVDEDVILAKARKNFSIFGNRSSKYVTMLLELDSRTDVAQALKPLFQAHSRKKAVFSTPVVAPQ